jgi:hypothetical protein
MNFLSLQITNCVFFVFILIFCIGIVLNYIIYYNRKQLIQQRIQSIYHSENYCPKTKYNIISNQNDNDISKIKFENYENQKIDDLIYETTDLYKELDDPNYSPNLLNRINNPVNIFRNNDISKWNIKMSSNN